MTNPTSSEGECPHCGKHFDHLPAHEWQCPEKPDEDENNVNESETDESESVDQDHDTNDDPDPPQPDTDQSNQSDDGSDSNASVIVDQVKPQEKDTRKNKDESEPQESEDENDDWVEIDYNSGKQVKTIMETTDLSEPRQAQKLLKGFKTGNVEDIPKFSEISLSDGELR